VNSATFNISVQNQSRKSPSHSANFSRQDLMATVNDVPTMDWRFMYTDY